MPGRPSASALTGERLERRVCGVIQELRPQRVIAQLLPRLQALRARTGGPDWILIDEVHHLLPTQWGQATFTLPQRLGETILITHRPSEVAPAILATMDTAVVVGPSPALTLGELATTLGVPPPAVPRTRRRLSPGVSSGDCSTTATSPARSGSLMVMASQAE